MQFNILWTKLGRRSGLRTEGSIKSSQNLKKKKTFVFLGLLVVVHHATTPMSADLLTLQADG